MSPFLRGKTSPFATYSSFNANVKFSSSITILAREGYSSASRFRRVVVLASSLAGSLRSAEAISPAASRAEAKNRTLMVMYSFDIG